MIFNITDVDLGRIMYELIHMLEIRDFPLLDRLYMRDFTALDDILHGRADWFNSKQVLTAKNTYLFLRISKIGGEKGHHGIQQECPPEFPTWLKIQISRGTCFVNFHHTETFGTSEQARL